MRPIAFGSQDLKAVRLRGISSSSGARNGVTSSDVILYVQYTNTFESSHWSPSPPHIHVVACLPASQMCISAAFPQHFREEEHRDWSQRASTAVVGVI